MSARHCTGCNTHWPTGDEYRRCPACAVQPTTNWVSRDPDLTPEEARTWLPEPEPESLVYREPPELTDSQQLEVDIAWRNVEKTWEHWKARGSELGIADVIYFTPRHKDVENLPPWCVDSHE